MATESPRPLARQLLRLALGAPAVPDRDLLARFVASRDEDAFAEIVRRHGPMVLAVCRRVTGRPHDAEDAFQAAFLVLARRAGHLRRPDGLANWLYGVACRTALEARAVRRRAEDHAVPAAPEPAAPPPPDDAADLRRVIDEELAKLPDKYRTAVVLCDLEGLPRAAAAAQMGIPEGTLSSRLAHARKVLAERLTRRGVTATTTAIGAALGTDARSAALPHTLTNITVSLAVRFAPGAGAPFGIAPAVSSLPDGVLKTMLVTRLRHLFATGLLACGVLGVGLAFAQQFPSPEPDRAPAVQPAGAEPVADPLVANAQPQPKPPEPKKYVAKGVEDDEVPTIAFPGQAVVRIEDGKLVVRTRLTAYVPTTVQTGANGAVTSYRVKKMGVHAATHDLDDVAVFDMKGSRLSLKAWKELLKSDVHVLVAFDGKLPNPRELTLFKSDTLLVVLPAQEMIPPPVYTPPAVPTAPSYTPVTDYVPRTYYVPTPPPPGRPATGVPLPTATPGGFTAPPNSATPQLPSESPSVGLPQPPVLVPPGNAIPPAPTPAGPPISQRRTQPPAPVRPENVLPPLTTPAPAPATAPPAPPTIESVPDPDVAPDPLPTSNPGLLPS
jgi:RNA polymerase sigma factor (sigma-70 family)